MPRLSFPTALCSGLLVALLCGAAGAAEPEPTPESRAHFRAGLDAFRANQWDTAYREFKAAYDITRKWTALGNLGMEFPTLSQYWNFSARGPGAGCALLFGVAYRPRGDRIFRERKKIRLVRATN